jgi:hypothetical protein
MANVDIATVTKPFQAVVPPENVVRREIVEVEPPPVVAENPSERESRRLAHIAMVEATDFGH